MDRPDVDENRPELLGRVARDNPLRPVWSWLDERLGLSALNYPVPAHANTIMYTLGGVTLVGFLILAVTGFYMAQFYHPHPNDARESLVYMVTRVDFGNFVRTVHFWASNLVVVTMFLHMLRVFLAASYKRPRELNWVVGVGLLFLTMAFFFTGTVLKWDQEGYEALRHQEALAKLLGSLGTVATTDFTRSVPLLTRLYLVHTSILPAIFTFLVLAHMFLVNYHKISPLPERGSGQGVTGTQGRSQLPGGISYFTTHVKELVGYGMVLAGLLSLLALAFPAVLGPQVVPGIEVTKPPLFFWWPYAFENWFGLGSLIWITIAFPLALVLVPFIDRSPMRHILDRRWMGIAALAIVLTWIALTVYVGLTPVVQHLEG